MQANSLPHKIMTEYTSVYQKLYNREPQNLRLLDSEWVEVSGARIRLHELENLTTQLQREYHHTRLQNMSLIKRWLMKLVS